MINILSPKRNDGLYMFMNVNAIIRSRGDIHLSDLPQYYHQIFYPHVFYDDVVICFVAYAYADTIIL